MSTVRNAKSGLLATKRRRILASLCVIGTILILALIVRQIPVQAAGIATTAPDSANALPLSAPRAPTDGAEPRRLAQITPSKTNQDARTKDPLLNLGFDTLADLADRGDRHASCLVVAMIAVCANPIDLKAWQETVVDLSAREPAGSVNEKAAIARLTRLEAFEPERKRICAGIPKMTPLEVRQRTRQAARLGVATAAVEYFLNPGEMTNAAGEGDPAQIDAYQREAMLLLERAAKAGNVDALNWLFLMYTTGHYPAGATDLRVPVDPVKAVAVGRELLAVIPDFLAAEFQQKLVAIESQLTPQDLAHASSLAQQYRVPRSQWDLSDFKEADQQLDNCSRE